MIKEILDKSKPFFANIADISYFGKDSTNYQKNVIQIDSDLPLITFIRIGLSHFVKVLKSSTFTIV